MKRLLLLWGILAFGINAYAQDTVITSPPLNPNNGQSGITFEVQSTQALNIIGLMNVFTSGETSADVWVRIGGVQHSAGSSPNISTANGWSQVITGAVISGANSSTKVDLPFGGTKINIPANTAVGFHIAGNTRYQTGTTGNAGIFTDGVLDVKTGDSYGYGGGLPTPTFHPRQFVGAVIYEQSVVGNCSAFTNFLVDSITSDAVRVNWTPGTNNNSFYIEYGPAGFTPGSGTSVTGTYPGTQPPVVLTGLTANTTYDIYLGEICNSGADSTYFPVAQQFTTTKACTAPTGLTISNVTVSSASASWNTLGAPNSFTILYGPAGFNPSGGTALSQTATSSPATISGLSGSTDYDAYIYADCGAIDGISDTVGPVSFRTPCSVVIAPWSDNFDGPSWVASGSNASNQIDPCWTATPDMSQGSEPFKWIPRSTGPTSGNGPLNDFTGGNFLYVEASGSSAGDIAELVTPPIDVSNLTAPSVYFMEHRYSGGNIADMNVSVSNDGGLSYTSVYNITGDVQTSSSDPWILRYINLSSYSGDTIILKFKQTGNGCCGDAAIDSLVVAEAPTCPWPTSLTVNSTSSTSATIGWTDPSGTNWDIEYGITGFSPGSGTVVNSSTNPYTITGLLANTTYDAYVRANCGTNGNSIWIGPLTFKTQCNPFTAPYSNNFDTDPQDVPPVCWFDYETYSSSFIEIENFTGTSAPYAGPQALYMYNSGASLSDTLMAISPNFSDMTAGDKQVRFHANSDDPITQLIVGTVANPQQPQTFVALDTITFSVPDTYQEVIVLIDSANGYNGTHQYVALMHNMGGTFDYIRIDEFNYELMPPCPKITGLVVNGVTNNSVSVSFNTNGGSLFNYEWGPTGFVQGNGTTGNITGSPANISGMSASQTYDLYIRADCGTDGVSIWEGPVTFTTACAPISAPYNENFDGSQWVASGSNANNQIDSCWISNPDVTQNSEPFKWIPRSTGPSSGNGPLNDVTGGNFMYVEASGSSAGDVASLTLPLIDLSALTVPGLYFMQHRYSNGSIADMDVEVSGNGGLTWNTLYSVSGDIQTSSSDPWSLEFINLAAYSNDTVLIRFVQYGNGCCGDAAIDSIVVDEAPACPWPNSLVVNNITSSSASIGWQDPSGTNWDIEYGITGYTPGTGTVVNTSTNPHTLTGLLANTIYDVYVRANCGTSGNSIWTGPLSFKTLCNPITATYFNSFDTDPQDEPPVCWFDYETYSPSFVEVENFTFTSAPYAGSQALYMYNSGANALDTLMAISPNFSDLTAADKQVRFYANSDDPITKLIVGTVAGPEQPETFVALDTITFNVPDTYQEVIVLIDSANGYNGTHQYVAFMHNMGGTFDYIRIDEFNYEPIPACPKISALTLLGTSVNSVNVSFNTNGGTLFNYEWGPTGFQQGTGTTGNLTGSPATIGGMSAAQTYDLYIRVDCGTAGVSVWEGPLTFTTQCNVLSLPYYESFDSWPLTCWDSLGGTEKWQPGGSAPDRYAMANYWNVNGGNYILSTSPIDITQQAQVRFSWSHLASTSYPDDQLYIRARTIGSNWDTIAHYRAGDGNFDDPTAGNTSPGSFIEDIHLLPMSYVGDTIQVELHGISDFGPHAYINNFYVEVAPSCPPTSLTNINAGIALGDSLSIYWTPGSGIMWQVEIGTPGFTPGLQIGIDSTLSSDTVEGFGNLSPNTTYEFYLRDSCAVGGLSPWVGPFSMTTGCANLTPITLPFVDGFENYSGPITTSGSFHCGPTFNWSFERPGNVGELQFTYSPSSGPSAPFNGTKSAGLSSLSSSQAVYLILTVDLSNYIGSPNAIQLSYMLADHFDETSTGDKVWIRGSMTDNWIQILDWNAKNATVNWKGDTVFMDQILAANGQTFSNTTQVRWGQQDNATMTGGDGLSIDDVVIEVITCPQPGSLTSSNITATSAMLSWDTVSASNSYQVWYGPTGFNQGTQTTGGTKVVTSNPSYGLSQLSSKTCYDYFVRAICGPGDTSAWSGPRTFCTGCAIFTAPYVETFDSASWVASGSNSNNQIDLCWSSTPDVTMGSEPFKWIPRNSGPPSGNGPLNDVTGGNFMYVEASGSSTGDVAELISPSIDVSNLNVPIMYFHQHRYYTSASGIADMKVEVSNDNGVTWTQEYLITGVTQNSSTDPWNEISVNLAAYAGDTIKVKFTQIGKGCCGDAAIDWFRVVETPTCFRPTNLSAGNITLTSADISWVTGGATNWQIVYGPGGFTPGGAGSNWVNASAIPTSITGLNPSSTYDVYVRDSCGPGDVSFWEGPLSFSTLCGVATAPFFENFDGGAWVASGSNANNQIPSCWNANPDMTQGSEPFKWIPRNTGPSSGNGPLTDVTGGNFMYVEASGSSTGDTATLTTPPIDLSTLSVPVMHFNQHRYYTSASGIADMDVLVSNNGGQTWTTEYSITGVTQASSSAPWDTITVNLASYAGDTVLVRFLQAGNGCCGDAAIDNLQIVDNVTCAGPSSLAATNVSCVAADLNWLSNTGNTSIVEFGPVGFTPGSGAGTTQTGSSPLTLTGLTPGTNYDFYVTDICGSDTSSIVGPVTFTTPTGPLSANYTFNTGLATPNDLTVTFDASSSQGGVLFIWDFDDNTPLDTGMNITHAFTANGAYDVLLVIQGPCGTDSITQTIVISGIGIEEYNFGNTLKLYPNPTTARLNVEFTAPEGKVELRLSSLSGQIIYQLEDNNANGTYRRELDLSRFAKGVYLLEISSGDKKTYRRVTKD